MELAGGALAVGATIVLYDGSPLHDDGTVLWRLAQDEQVTFFGAGAKFYDSTRKAGLHPGADFDLHRVRTVASTGSPLAAADFRFLYDELGPDIHLASISGGTDICGCFVLGDPTRPVFAGEIQGPALGADIDVIDADARTVRAPEPGSWCAATGSQHAPCGSAATPMAPAIRPPLLRPSRLVDPRRLRALDRPRRHRDHRAFRRHPQRRRGPHRDG